MKSVLIPITATALLAVLVLPSQIIAQAEKQASAEHFPHYRAKDLGTLGGLNSIAFGLNNT